MITGSYQTANGVMNTLYQSRDLRMYIMASPDSPSRRRASLKEVT